MHQASARPSGALTLQVVHAGEPVATEWPRHVLSLAEIARYGAPRRDLPDEVNRWRRANRPNLARGVRKVALAKLLKIPTFYGQLFLTAIRADGDVDNYGLAGLRLVTTTGVKFICDDFNNNAQDVSTMRFHGFGTGAGAEAVGNTALSTEVTNTTYVGDVRPTGSQASATVSNDATYTTVGTYTPDSGTPIAVTEHGVFSANATGTLLDKTLFAVINLATGDSLQATYVLTMVAGG